MHPYRHTKKNAFASTGVYAANIPEDTGDEIPVLTVLYFVLIFARWLSRHCIFVDLHNTYNAYTVGCVDCVNIVAL